MGTNTPDKPHIVPLTLAPDGFVYADSVKVARFVPERGTLEFVDRNRQRCEQLGRQTVEVPVADVAKLAESTHGQAPAKKAT